MEVFRNFDQDAKDNADFQQTPLTMPMLVLGGEKSGGDFLITQGKMVATNRVGIVLIYALASAAALAATLGLVRRWS